MRHRPWIGYGPALGGTLFCLYNRLTSGAARLLRMKE
jgi:hypothetical protein